MAWFDEYFGDDYLLLEEPGDLETVAAGVEERRQMGVDLPVISMPMGTPQDVERILGMLTS